MKILILADDLSGAADCAAAAGQASLVLLRPDCDAEADIIAIDMDSRAIPPQSAAKRAGSLLESVSVRSAMLVYQKLDSTLRGNWAAELGALHRVLENQRGASSLVIFAPALPEKERTMTGGQMFLNGVPLAATELWAAERAGFKPDIGRMLTENGLTSTLLEAGQTPGALAGCMLKAITHRTDVVICDAMTGADLQAIATAGLRLSGESILWAGSSGLMRVLASGSSTSAPTDVPIPAVSGPIAIVIGSASATTHQQLASLRAEPDLNIIELSPECLREDDVASVQAIANASKDRRDMVFAIAGEMPAGVVVDSALPEILAHKLAPQIRQAGALILAGGATARAVLESVGIEAIDLRGEIEAGVPMGVTRGALSVPVVTKAGAFGSPDTLANSLRALRAARGLGDGKGNAQWTGR